MDNLVEDRRKLLQPRSFNSLYIDPVLSTITKISSNNSKLKREINWYKKIPDELKILTPRIVSEKEIDGKTGQAEG